MEKLTACPGCHTLLTHKEKCPNYYNGKCSVRYMCSGNAFSFYTKSFFIISDIDMQDISVYSRTFNLKHRATLPFIPVDFSKLDEFDVKINTLLAFT